MTGQALCRQVVHGTAIAIDGRAVILTGSPGSGKSELAIALIERGAALIGDDLVTLDGSGDRLMVRAVLPLRHRMMIRGIGLVAVPQSEACFPLALMIALRSSDARRTQADCGPQALGSFGPVGNFHCPMVTLDPRSQIITAKVHMALERWGL